MKFLGSTIVFTHQRNADIMRVFRRKLAEARVIRMPDICRQIAQSPASRFWVSESRAAIVISAMAAGRPLHSMSPCKREMFAEIYRRYTLLRPLYPHMSMLDLATIIVNQPAPKFYLTPGTIRELIRRIRSGYYDSK